MRIELSEVQPGDFLVSDGKSVRLKVQSVTPDKVNPTIHTADGINHHLYTWRVLGFHADRPGPPQVFEAEGEVSRDCALNFAKHGGGTQGAGASWIAETLDRFPSGTPVHIRLMVGGRP